MSKLIDRLKRLSQAAPEPMGFRARQVASSKPKIQIMVSAMTGDLASLGDSAAYADALLLCLDGQRPGDLPGAITGALWGMRPGNIARAEVQEMHKQGCDFIVIPADAPVTMLDNTGMGKILEVEASLDDGLVRTISQLPVDAVLVNSGLKAGEPLTLKHLMLLQRFAGLAGKPLIVSTTAGVGASELLALWAASVDCLVVEFSAQNQDKLRELRQTIDGLAFPFPRRREILAPVLPFGGTQAGVTREEGGEEEEEEE